MEETLIQKRSAIPQTKFEEDIEDFLVEHEFHSVYDDGHGNLVCYYGNRYQITDFLPDCEKVAIWRNLQKRYAAGER